MHCTWALGKATVKYRPLSTDNSMSQKPLQALLYQMNLQKGVSSFQVISTTKK